MFLGMEKTTVASVISLLKFAARLQIFCGNWGPMHTPTMGAIFRNQFQKPVQTKWRNFDIKSQRPMRPEATIFKLFKNYVRLLH